MNHEYDVEAFKKNGFEQTKVILDVKNTAQGMLEIYQEILKKYDSVS